MSTRIEEFVRAALSFEGVPYRHRGNDELGLDCLHLVIVAGQQAGIIAPDFVAPEYSQKTSTYKLLEGLTDSGLLVRLPRWSAAERGDLIIQKFHVRLPGSHVLIVTKRTDVDWWAVHASLLTGRVVTQRIAHRERCVAAFRFAEVANG